jgi:hypothetical protein
VRSGVTGTLPTNNLAVIRFIDAARRFFTASADSHQQFSDKEDS